MAPAVQELMHVSGSVALTWPVLSVFAALELTLSLSDRQLFSQILMGKSCCFFHAQWNAGCRSQVILTAIWLLQLPLNTLVMQQVEAEVVHSSHLLDEGPCTLPCCQGCGKTLTVWQDNGAMPWRRPKSLSVPYLNLPLAFKGWTLLLCSLLQFGFALPMSFMGWSQLRAWFNIGFVRVTMAKTRGRLAGHSLQVAAASSEQHKERRMGRSYPNVLCHSLLLWVMSFVSTSSHASVMHLARSTFSPYP